MEVARPWGTLEVMIMLLCLAACLSEHLATFLSNPIHPHFGGMCVQDTRKLTPQKADTELF